MSASGSAEQFGLEVVRTIKAPLAQVYAAWTDPAQLRQWFGPKKVKTLELVADVRVGGEFRWRCLSPEGEDMTVEGEYRELQPNKKVVFTWQWQDDDDWKTHRSVVTVHLAERDDGTEVRLVHEGLPSEQSKSGHTGGWESALEKLEEFVSQ